MPDVAFSEAAKPPMAQTCAIVLGGGQGTRLYPLTALRAKPAVPLLGRYRLIDIPLTNCVHSDIRRIFVLTQFNSASLNRHIHNSYQFDYFSKGFVDVLAAEQTQDSPHWFQGTADAVRQHLVHLRGAGANHYLILSGDQLYRMDYRAFLAAHLSSGADVTVATLPVTKAQAPSFGIMKVRKNGRIEKFVEKPRPESDLEALVTPEESFRRRGIDTPNRPYLASMGVYLFDAQALEDALALRPDWIDFGKHVIPGILRKYRVSSFVFDGFWEDIGTVRSYYDTHMRIARPNPPFHFFDPAHITYTHPRYLPGARVQDASIADSIICEGTRISKAKISESVIGIRSVLRDNVRIESSIVMGADYLENDEESHDVPIGIGAGARITRAIIDKNARIGAGVGIRGSHTLPDQEGPGWAIRDGIVVVFKNATIAPGTRIG